jgi:hypothetical protein
MDPRSVHPHRLLADVRAEEEHRGRFRGDANLVRGLGWVAGNGDGALSLLAGGGRLGSCDCPPEENERKGKGRGLEQVGVTSKVGTLPEPAAVL